MAIGNRKVFVVLNKETGTSLLVKARTKAQARNYAIGEIYDTHVAQQDELIDALKNNQVIYEVTEEPDSPEDFDS